MKKLLKTYPDKCIACHLCESVCSGLYFKEDNAAKSCIRINDSQNPIDMNVCNQCQTCVKTCPTQALTVNSLGVIMLNKKLCIGCLMCVAACPTKSMMHFEGALSPFKCIACGACAKQCPAEAIRIETEE
ncbi:MAG TPA: 4Fe-4S binding protein [Candidatus Cloacimonadota bacterium]|nr:4Fe-4S binding protein [Candidatus Cloacimonadota bacterium]